MGIVARRRVRETGDRGGLRDAELRRGGAEVERARRADTYRPFAEPNAIQVLFHDLLLAQMGLESQGPEGLCELSAPAPLRGLQQAGELHGDGGRARDCLACAEVGLECAAHGEHVYAGVLPEAFVL